MVQPGEVTGAGRRANCARNLGEPYAVCEMARGRRRCVTAVRDFGKRIVRVQMPAGLALSVRWRARPQATALFLLMACDFPSPLSDRQTDGGGRRGDNCRDGSR